VIHVMVSPVDPPSVRHALLAVLLLLLAVCSSARPRTGRDWSKLTEEDWKRIESEWETPEEKEEYEFKPPQQKGVDMEKLQGMMAKKGKKSKAKVQDIIAESQVSSGPAMMFATLDYPDCCVKKKTEEIATGWASMLKASGMDISTYVIEDNQVLFSTQTGLHASEIRDFVVKQDECVAVEWNSKRTPGPAETPEWKAKDAANKAAKEAKTAAKKAEEEAVKKAEERLKRKRKKKKKAKEEL